VFDDTRTLKQNTLKCVRNNFQKRICVAHVYDYDSLRDSNVSAIAGNSVNVKLDSQSDFL